MKNDKIYCWSKWISLWIWNLQCFCLLRKQTFSTMECPVSRSLSATFTFPTPLIFLKTWFPIRFTLGSLCSKHTEYCPQFCLTSMLVNCNFPRKLNVMHPHPIPIGHSSFSEFSTPRLSQSHEAIIFFKISFLLIHERHRKRQKQAEGEAGSLQGAQCETWSQGPGITPWAKGGCSTSEPPRHAQRSYY